MQGFCSYSKDIPPPPSLGNLEDGEFSSPLPSTPVAPSSAHQVFDYMPDLVGQTKASFSFPPVPLPSSRDGSSPPKQSRSAVVSNSKPIRDSSWTNITQMLLTQLVAWSLSPPVDILRNGKKKWHLAIVGFFPTANLLFKEVEIGAHKAWGYLGLTNVFSYAQGCSLFKFNTVSEHDRVLAAGPRLLANKPIIDQQWK